MEFPIITLVRNMRLQGFFNGISGAFISEYLIHKPNSDMVDKYSNKRFVSFRFTANPDIPRRELNKVDNGVEGRKPNSSVYVCYVFA
jgi:hypothetical protein